MPQKPFCRQNPDKPLSLWLAVLQSARSEKPEIEPRYFLLIFSLCIDPNGQKEEKDGYKEHPIERQGKRRSTGNQDLEAGKSYTHI